MTLLRRHVWGARSTSISSGTIYNASPDLDEILIISSCGKHGKVWHQSLLVCRFVNYAVESNRNMVVGLLMEPVQPRYEPPLFLLLFQDSYMIWRGSVTLHLPGLGRVLKAEVPRFVNNQTHH